MKDNQDKQYQLEMQKKQEEKDINFLSGLFYGFGVSILAVAICSAINNFSMVFISLFFLVAIGIAAIIVKNKGFIIGFTISTILLYFMGQIMWAITCGGGRIG